ncbi:SubName: Full=Uncharacterized protein {ECO:0000313/EMBL:CCA76413.1} [Serendipita indica DSM 11827]|nr:SubName: Full=Uncharacterized protein {ECO:0000313/EMBL:CCA76413.1} [Serendipita indica DSM 11827]
MESTGNEEQVDHESRLDTSATAYSRRRPASTDALSLTETLTCPNSLETEMNVTAEDRKEFRPVLEVLSLEPPPLGNSGLIRGPTWRTKTIGRLRFPDTTKRSLDALVTNSFTPTQLPAARHIQRFIQANPDTSLPLFLITKEIAEIYGEHGWCLIGKCGLGRITYKIACLTSTNDVTDEELVKDSSRRRIDILCGHIRDRHFEQMLFRCRLCPASYMSQDELSRHWRTHAVGDTERSLLHSPSVSSRLGALQQMLSSKRASWAQSHTTSTISSSVSSNLFITSSQQASPSASPELAQLDLWVEGNLASTDNDHRRSLITLFPPNDRIIAYISRPGSPTPAVWPNAREDPIEPTAGEEDNSTLDIMNIIYDAQERANADTFSLAETLTCPNSLEVDMDVGTKDYEK